MYKCSHCRSCFDEPDIHRTSYEEYYGVSDEFYGRTSLALNVCPYCGSEDIEQDNLCESCKWHNIDSDHEDYCEEDESYDCDWYEEV